MKKEKKYRKRLFKRWKWQIFGGIFFLLIIIGAISLELNKHLLIIQNIERLDKLVDYSEFKLSLTPKSKCYDEIYLIYETDDLKYYTKCLKSADIYYGSTKTTIADALKKNYLDLDLLIKHTIKQSYDNKIIYTSQKFSNKGNYVVTRQNVIDGKDRIIISSL